MPFKPMLAAKAVAAKIKFPSVVQPKLDGIRCTIQDGKPLSRTLKLIPNLEIQAALAADPSLEGLDGELIVGDPRDKDCYRKTASFCMAPNKTGESWAFYVFDKVDTENPGLSFSQRYLVAGNTVEDHAETKPDGSPLRVVMVPSTVVHDADQLEAFERKIIAEGHEGVILRNPSSPYKHGRGSATAGDLLKMKRFTDSEAIVIGVYEELHNANEAKTNALGRTERSTVKANKHGKGTLGGFIVRDVVSGVEFRVGTGFDAAERADLWAQWHREGGQLLLKNAIIKYKYFEVGVKDKPRHPVFLGFRHEADMPSTKEV